MCDGTAPAQVRSRRVASSGGPGWAPSAPWGAPEVCGVLVRCPTAETVGCGAKRSTAIGPFRTDHGEYPADQAVAASSSSTWRARAGSMWTPGPMVVATVTDSR